MSKAPFIHSLKVTTVNCCCRSKDRHHGRDKYNRGDDYNRSQGGRGSSGDYRDGTCSFECLENVSLQAYSMSEKV